jgi:hypothetical protein
MKHLLAELRALESELHHPGAACTRERLEQLLHPDFHEVARSGRRYTRQIVIDYLVARTRIPPVATNAHRLQMLAPDWALLSYRSEEIANDGTRLNAALRASLWTRTPAGWQLFYHHGTPEHVEA